MQECVFESKQVAECAASSICCSITIDVMYLPLPSSAEVCVYVCVCSILPSCCWI